ncbi:hypothetical protein KFK09_012046 [Dendrobium nobile]|uniref:Uncharacterized protein n=1 Tax=Dendrobium nobile TaxID=94219 RepID=A0A8T3BEA5_DENNO|nr:hypothetical protein KFK09_012042 [Dendrobium nobile]KAI0511416.1 hypothetical protein KFK09_012046 [Dendrobium nobile]
MITTFLAPRVPTVSGQRKAPKEKCLGARAGGNFKQLIDMELQYKRAKGLCFRCDEKFAPDHRCKNRTLQVCFICDKEKIDEVEVEGEVVEEEEPLYLEVAEVLLNFVVGFISNHTMKMRGQIGGEAMAILVDSGDTHNVISNHAGLFYL